MKKRFDQIGNRNHYTFLKYRIAQASQTQYIMGESRSNNDDCPAAPSLPITTTINPIRDAVNRYSRNGMPIRRCQAADVANVSSQTRTHSFVVTARPCSKQRLWPTQRNAENSATGPGSATIADVIITTTTTDVALL